MRSINPETSKPYPRQRPVDWAMVRRVLRSRQDARDKKQRGFIAIDPTRCGGFQVFDAIRQRRRKITDVEISCDGSMIYIKIEGE